MPSRLLALAASVAAAWFLAPSASFADAYPSRPITFIVPWGPGGGADQVARMASKLMEPELKVSVPVVNMPGATGQTGHQKLLTSPSDGYTLEIMTADTFATLAQPNSRFKIEQFIPVAVLIQQRSGLFVNATGPIKTFEDITKGDKELRVAITGYNSPDDLSIKLLGKQGAKLQGIPFAEPGLRYASVIGGQSDIVYEQAGDVRSFLDGKQIKPILFFSDKPAAGFEDTPYSGKLGIDVKLSQFRMVVVRADTDPAIVKKLSEVLSKVAQSAEYKAYLAQQYAQPDSYVGSDQALPFIKGWLAEFTALMPKRQAAQ
ncbi:tripartite tricarboxylate transporter substrate binding protein [Hansschlegelia beijingensis]|uniref:Tripartite-type tricarboxylate transporter receptor subunit TctC n=1 Tax=Hansschlegelia beijingensis TaxID=1133344 RepID=A0A7W6D272_9HYPH|nr:tripartite tricarboxylate transporter substrate binding protein [Hansschlegelia beijingensis]MBB3972747.1 tripartite-type tricarboxylate transporter receptor subunit TctC [Hansschlegelia beijingensis]